MDPVVHFEMPAEDRNRMAKFYSTVFGWKAQLLGPEMGNYVTVSTVESDENGRPTVPGGINGGFYPKGNDRPTQYPSLVIAVENIAASIEKVKAHGGKMINEPTDIPGVGSYTSFYDTEGNTVSLLQPIMQ